MSEIDQMKDIPLVNFCDSCRHFRDCCRRGDPQCSQEGLLRRVHQGDGRQIRLIVGAKLGVDRQTSFNWVLEQGSGSL